MYINCLWDSCIVLNNICKTKKVLKQRESPNVLKKFSADVPKVYYWEVIFNFLFVYYDIEKNPVITQYHFKQEYF